VVKQFIANDAKQFLKIAQARQEFTHIANPEENAYIEAFHSIVEREVIQRFEFSSYYDAKKTFEAHLKWYNYTRKHGQLGKITPQQKWEGYFNKKNDNLAMPDEAETGYAGEQPVRNNPVNEDDPGRNREACSCPPLIIIVVHALKNSYRKRGNRPKLF